MTSPDVYDWRKIGDTTVAVYEAEFRRLDSPLLRYAADLHAAASPHSALALAHMYMENKYSTTGHIISPGHHNPMALRPGPGITVPHGTTRAPDGGQFLAFETPVDCIREWRRRIADRTYKGGVYTSTQTLREYLRVYAPAGDVHPVTGKDNADIGYDDTVMTMLRRFAAQEEPPMAPQFGNVPHPGYIDIQHEMAGKPEGRGWNNLGKREIYGVALHRMWGTLSGTRSHFGNPRVASLTDYGIGTANVDGPSNDGVIHLYNNPRGYRSGWASGPVSAPYGDGRLFVNKYGVNAVNRFLTSVETSGYDTEPFTDFAWKELVHLVAYLADQAKVPYTSLPLNPHTGINFIIWHEELTFGTGKKCPFTWMKQQTGRLYRDVIAFLKPYQEGTVAGPGKEPPKEEEPQEPTWMAPAPVRELALADPSDADTVAHLAVVNGHEFDAVFDDVVPVRRTRQYRFAYPDAPDTFAAGDPLPGGVHVIGPDLVPDEDGEGPVLHAMYKFIADDGRRWYYLGNHARVLADDFKRVGD